MATAGASAPTSTGRTAVLVVVVVVIIVMLALPMRAWFAQQAEITSLEEKIGQAQVDLRELAAEGANWEDPAFVEAQARLRLGFVRPGEVGFVTLQDSPETSNEQLPATWQEQLWRSVEAASGRTVDGSAGEPIEVRDDAPR